MARSALPSLLTLLGLLAGLAGAVLLPSLAGAVLLVLSLLLDGLDGAVARRLGVSSGLGARLDLGVDVAVAHAVAWAAWPGPVAAAVSSGLAVAGAAAPEVTRARVSGRVLVSTAAVVWSWASGSWRVVASPGELAALGGLAAAAGVAVVWWRAKGLRS